MQTVSLVDLGPVTETVPVAGNKKLSVKAVNWGDVLVLVGRFPEIADLVGGKTVTAARLMQMGAEAINAIIAAACGHTGDQKAETNAGNLSLEVQTDILTAVVRLTLPSGIGPFAKKLGALTALAKPAEESTERKIRVRTIKSA